jgi:hypothetical protein
MNGIAQYIAAWLASAAMMAAGILYVLKKMIAADSRRREMELLSKNKGITLSLRLQAYERLLLFLERNSPTSLVLRLQPQSRTNAELHAAVIAAIREEFEHNLTQQLYVSAALWEQFVLAKNKLMQDINSLTADAAPDNSSMQLAQKILNEYVRKPPPTKAIADALKREAARLF